MKSGRSTVVVTAVERKTLIKQNVNCRMSLIACDIMISGAYIHLFKLYSSKHASERERWVFPYEQ